MPAIRTYQQGVAEGVARSSRHWRPRIHRLAAGLVAVSVLLGYLALRDRVAGT